MQVTWEVRIRCEDAHHARVVNEAVARDNEGYVESRVEGNVIVARADAGSVYSLLHTLNDFLSCLSMAMEIVSTMKGDGNSSTG
ncbi:MAG: hypothetical protein FE046_02510 [Thermoplasmata archaeon]|nr:MAG: hypothetical protein FE046_02510 [Thermoplasmata archaeon]RLF32965.1 MAG: hypothetical protein DRN07_03755 [Thermoplasmata archaeon]